MAEKKRQCGTCRFFAEKEASGHGKCTHPKRAGTDADLLLLRPTELACRTRWGSSLWQDPADDSDPMAPTSPQQPSLPEPIAAQLHFDDEVTSVSIAGSKTSRSSFEDDVVDSGATATGMASWDDPVQEERLDLLRKSSHDALAGARKRHMEKQARQRELVPFAEDEEVHDASTSKEQASKQTLPEPAVEPSNTFPPADFVEDERTAAEHQSADDDELVDDGLAPDRNRTPRLRKLMRDPNDPKKNEAMRMSLPSDMRVTSHNPENREQWNSVPTLNPGIELPLTKISERPASSPVKVAASAAPMMSASYQPRPVSQARELLSEDRLRQERAQRQMVAPLEDESPVRMGPQAEVVHRPRLTEAPAQDVAPIERIKSSPLRGYHPATRKLVQQPARERPLAPQMEEPRQELARQRTPQGAPQHSTNLPTSPHSYDASPRQREQPRPKPRTAPEQTRAEHNVPAQDRHQASTEGRRRDNGRQPSVPVREVSTPFRYEPIQIAPKVARRCGTCTSYRPSGVQGRGSCANDLAGPVQRVVYEQDLACQHTYGSLWLPADERVWLKELPDNTGPTPRVDAMLARKRRRETTVLPDLEELTS